MIVGPFFCACVVKTDVVFATIDPAEGDGNFVVEAAGAATGAAGSVVVFFATGAAVAFLAEAVAGAAAAAAVVAAGVAVGVGKVLFVVCACAPASMPRLQCEGQGWVHCDSVRLDWWLVSHGWPWLHLQISCLLGAAETSLVKEYKRPDQGCFWSHNQSKVKESFVLLLNNLHLTICWKHALSGSRVISNQVHPILMTSQAIFWGFKIKRHTQQ